MLGAYHHDVSKRTTVTLEDDVVQRLTALARHTGRPFKEVLNEVVRQGLEHSPARPAQPFRVEARDMRVLPGVQLDDISALLEQVEGPAFR